MVSPAREWSFFLPFNLVAVADNVYDGVGPSLRMANSLRLSLPVTKGIIST